MQYCVCTYLPLPRFQFRRLLARICFETQRPSKRIVLAPMNISKLCFLSRKSRPILTYSYTFDISRSPQVHLIFPPAAPKPRKKPNDQSLNHYCMLANADMHTLTFFSVVLALYTVLVHSQDVKRTDLTETGYSKDASEMQGGQSEINDYQSIDSRQLTDCQKAGERTTCVYKIRLPG